MKTRTDNELCRAPNEMILYYLLRVRRTVLRNRLLFWYSREYQKLLRKI